jgi:hypothetical protein
LCRDFSSMLTTMAFDHSSLRWFEANSCKSAPRGLPSSLAQLNVFAGEKNTHNKRISETEVGLMISLFLCDLGQLGALERNVGHQAFDVEHKGDNRIVELGEIDALATADVDEGDVAVDPYLPALAGLELL